MREIDSIVIHCSAIKAGQNFAAKDMERWHRQRGFKDIGYYYAVRLDETLERGWELFYLWIILLCVPFFFCGCGGSKKSIDYRSDSRDDSAFVMAHEENVSEQSIRSESSARVVTERLEEMIMMIPQDTLFAHPALWVKTTFERKTEKDRQFMTDNKVDRMDSLAVNSMVESRKLIEAEKTQVTQPVNVWLKIGFIVCVFVGGYLGYLLYKYFSRVART